MKCNEAIYGKNPSKKSANKGRAKAKSRTKKAVKVVKKN